MLRHLRFAVLAAGSALTFSALAQPAPDNSAAVDPPSRVARLSYIHGDVSFVPAGENDWVQAPLNRPLITGDKLWTDRDSRASLEMGDAAVRMDQSTSFDFLNLTDNAAQMELTQGTLNLRVRRLYDGQSYEIDTPTLAFVVNRVGEFRIDVEPNGQSTLVTVLSGGGDVYGEGGARFAVDEGQSVAFHDPQLRDYQVSDLPRPDAFDDFCHARDTRWDNSSSRRYVSEDVIGYQDLDDYGQWSDVPEYGNVWYPTSVAVGWSPYHYGHWGWVGAYGWTWIDDAPWGFAPFHYGRWANVGGRWGWCPGPIAVRPVYAPALVAFVGGFGGVGISVGGPIGWFPLGYRDPYFPPYRVSRGYFNRINVSNTVINNTVINNYYGNYSRGNVNYTQIRYANRNIAGAVTAVPAAAFVGARPVAGAAVAINRTAFANARVSGFAALAPTRASLAPAVAARGVPAAAVLKRPIVAATRPPAPVASFAQRRAVLEKNPGRPLNEHELRGPAIAAGAVAGGAAAAHAMAARPNVRVVTQHGAPLRESAPALPARAAINARPAAPSAIRRANPATRESARPATTVQGAAPAAASEAPRHLDSSRFAHPGNSVREAQPTRPLNTPARIAPSRTIEHAAPVRQPPRVEEKSDKGGNPGGASAYSGRPESHAPVPQRSVQTYHPPQSVQHTPVQTRQEYHAPVVQPRQEYHAPAQPRQEYHAPAAQPRQEYRAPPVQHQPPPERKKEDKKEDKKQNGGGR
ncbi:MAG: DUF6600 domain-containing protein [Rudaea sp.]